MQLSCEEGLCFYDLVLLCARITVFLRVLLWGFAGESIGFEILAAVVMAKTACDCGFSV